MQLRHMIKQTKQVSSKFSTSGFIIITLKSFLTYISLSLKSLKPWPPPPRRFEYTSKLFLGEIYDRSSFVLSSTFSYLYMRLFITNKGHLSRIVFKRRNKEGGNIFPNFSLVQGLSTCYERQELFFISHHPFPVISPACLFCSFVSQEVTAVQLSLSRTHRLIQGIKRRCELSLMLSLCPALHCCKCEQQP